MSAAARIEEYLDKDEKRKWVEKGRLDVEIQVKNMELARTLKHREEKWTTCKDTVPLDFGIETINIALVGMGGSGKSSLGNVLVNKGTVFHTGVSIGQETTECKGENGVFGPNNQAIRIWDTPGYFLTSSGLVKNKAILELALKEVQKMKHGIHVLIMVTNLANARDRDEEVKILKDLKMLNTNSMSHCMIVASHGNSHYTRMGTSELLSTFQNSIIMKEFMADINNRIVITDATGSDDSDALPGFDTPCKKEKEQARQMVMNMVAKVIADKTKSSTPVTYTEEAMKKDLNSCFPAQAMVYTSTTKKSMEELCLGNEVLALDAQGVLRYQPIIMFGHFTKDLHASFLSIHTACGKVLRVSPGHLLHVNKHGKLLAAKDVQVGDVVFTADDDEGGNVKESHVTAVTSEQLPGLYCPHTPSGSIIVDGVLASCYTNILPSVVAHAAMFPVRLLYRILPHEWFIWILPYNKRSGMPCILERLKAIRMSLTY